uniref:Uncharacterized protein n=1 Tax=Bracon brevicornis TaxID=1563983 RepID=A0A6V7LIU0_9HYME
MLVSVESPPFREPNLRYPIEVLVQLFRHDLTRFGEPSIIQLRPLQENKPHLFHNVVTNLQSGITISKLPIPGENQPQPSSSVLSMDPPSNITNRLMPVEPQLVHYESENTSPVSDPFLGRSFEEDQQLTMPTIEPMIGPEADDYVTPDAWSYVDGAINWSLLFGHDQLEIDGEPIPGPSGLRSDTANKPFYPTNDDDSDD